MKGALACTAWKLLRRVGTWVTGCALAHALGLGAVSSFLAIGFCGTFTCGMAWGAMPIAATPLGFLYGAAFGMVVWAVTRFAPKDDR